MTPPMFLAPAGASGQDRVALDGPEGHHAADVRRLRPGETVWLTDGRGTRGTGRIEAVRRGALDVVMTEWRELPQPSPRLVVVQALAKGGRDEDAVEAMTEVGVDEVIGWSASRSVAKWTERTAAKWRNAAEAASRQSRRTWWPTIAGPLATPEVAARVARSDRALVLSETATDALTVVSLANTNEIVLVVGPEGGISEDELSTFADAGAQAVRLGDTVLRSSTAGVAALAAVLSRTRWS